MEVDDEGYLQVNLGLDALLNAYGGSAGGGPALLGAEAASLLGADLAEMIKAGGQPGGDALAVSASLRGAVGPGGGVAAGLVASDGGYGLGSGEGYGLGVDRDVASELRHHRDEVVRRAVDEAKDAAAHASSRHQSQRAAAQWRAERKDLLNSLSVTFSHAAAAEAAFAAAPPMALLGGGGSALGAAQVDAGQLVRVAGGALVPASALPGGALGGGAASVLTAAMKANANVVRRVNGKCLGDAAARGEKVWPCRAYEEAALRSSPASSGGGGGP